MHKYQLVLWDMIYQGKHTGGLGVRRVTFNRALLGKWMWRFAIECNRLWQQVIVAKYDVEWGNWWTGRVGWPHGRAL